MTAFDSNMYPSSHKQSDVSDLNCTRLMATAGLCTPDSTKRNSPSIDLPSVDLVQVPPNPASQAIFKYEHAFPKPEPTFISPDNTNLQTLKSFVTNIPAALKPQGSLRNHLFDYTGPAGPHILLGEGVTLLALGFGARYFRNPASLVYYSLFALTGAVHVLGGIREREKQELRDSC